MKNIKLISILIILAGFAAKGFGQSPVTTNKSSSNNDNTETLFCADYNNTLTIFLHTCEDLVLVNSIEANLQGIDNSIIDINVEFLGEQAVDMDTHCVFYNNVTPNKTDDSKQTKGPLRSLNKGRHKITLTLSENISPGQIDEIHLSNNNWKVFSVQLQFDYRLNRRLHHFENATSFIECISNDDTTIDVNTPSVSFKTMPQRNQSIVTFQINDEISRIKVQAIPLTGIGANISLVDQMFTEGIHKIRLDELGLPNGVYQIVWTDGETRQTGKIVIF